MHPIALRAVKTSEPIAALVRDFYGSQGPLVAAGWEVRPQQREMSLRFAEQIDGAAASIGLIEAPTGTGKGLSYLVPGVLAALRAEAIWTKDAIRRGKEPDEVEPNGGDYFPKLLVSTANIALQGQLMGKDIPALSKMLGLTVRATLMKSRSNYVCREELRSQRSTDELDRLIRWLDAGGSGDREHIDWPVAEIWPRVSRGADDCLAESCAHWGGEKAALCCWRAAVEAWPSAHVLVANHHWAALAAGLATVAYAVDEAHELEEALRGVQQRRLMVGNFGALASRYAALTKADDATRRELEARVEAIQAPLFAALNARIEETRTAEGDAPVLLPAPWVKRRQGPGLEAAFGDLLALRDDIIQSALDRGCALDDAGRVRYPLREETEVAKEGRTAASVANRAISLCRSYSAVVLGRAHPDWHNRGAWAIWAEVEQDRKGQQRLVANLVPADVAPVFSALHLRYPKMVLTSATLPAFQAMRLALGLGILAPEPLPIGWPAAWRTGVGKLRGLSLDSAEGYEADDGADADALDDSTLRLGSGSAPAPIYEVRLPSPYPLAQLGILVVPPGPAPTERGWREWAEEKVVEAVVASAGGALVLASSVAQMRRYAAALRERTPFQVLCQGETGRAGLVAAFKSDKDSVLCATRSFFAGLDVQGEACRLVVIDRIPFPSPDDPVENAVGRLLVERNRGGNPWRLRSVPLAAMILAQGVGRLIRSQSDYGAVVLLDTRILDRKPGWMEIRRALPPFPLYGEIAQISRHLQVYS